MKYIPLIGRTLFSLIFLMTIMGSFSTGTIAYASSAGVPMANVLVPVSGIIALIGAISIVLGFQTRVGGWLIVIFLAPVTLYMHQFWTVKDPMVMQMQMVNFIKNISMLGGALLIIYFGPGPVSIDGMKKTQQ
jgi:putative oxidoreductase